MALGLVNVLLAIVVLVAMATGPARG